MHPLPEYPRPSMRRDSYVNLNGLWDYAITQSSEFPVIIFAASMLCKCFLIR